MLGKSNICAVLAVTDRVQAKEFYEGKLGLSVEQDFGDAGALYKSGDSKVYIYPSEFAGTNKATAASWNVSDLAACVEELKGKGVTFEHYDLPGVKMEGDIHVNENMRSAWFVDPFGNILAINEDI